VVPELFQSIRVLVDEPGRARRFLVLGSAAPELLRQSSETLAGRIAYHELPGLSVEEVGPSESARLWRRVCGRLPSIGSCRKSGDFADREGPRSACVGRQMTPDWAETFAVRKQTTAQNSIIMIN
jgi:hypothetical protein